MSIPHPTPRILIALPDHDFDPTESATPWKLCSERGWAVSFSTEHGAVAAADHRLLKGPILGPLGAGPKGLAAYRQMTHDSAYQHPIPYAEIDPPQFDGLVLPGGHAPGMKQFLESTVLQGKILQFWRQGAVIGAICHGVLAAARTVDPQTGRSILYGSQVTALTKDLEMTGFGLTFWLLGRRYRTYSCYVADEVRLALERPQDFKAGKSMLLPFAYRDRRLVTARWPLDAMLFTRMFMEALEEQLSSQRQLSTS